MFARFRPPRDLPVERLFRKDAPEPSNDFWQYGRTPTYGYAGFPDLGIENNIVADVVCRTVKLIVQQAVDERVSQGTIYGDIGVLIGTPLVTLAAIRCPKIGAIQQANQFRQRFVDLGQDRAIVQCHCDLFVLHVPSSHLMIPLSGQVRVSRSRQDGWSQGGGVSGTSCFVGGMVCC